MCNCCLPQAGAEPKRAIAEDSTSSSTSIDSRDLACLHCTSLGSSFLHLPQTKIKRVETAGHGTLNIFRGAVPYCMLLLLPKGTLAVLSPRQSRFLSFETEAFISCPLCRRSFRSPTFFTCTVDVCQVAALCAGSAAPKDGSAPAQASCIDTFCSTVMPDAFCKRTATLSLDRPWPQQSSTEALLRGAENGQVDPFAVNRTPHVPASFRSRCADTPGLSPPGPLCRTSSGREWRNRFCNASCNAIPNQEGCESRT